MPKDAKNRRRVVVEEVGSEETKEKEETTVVGETKTPGASEPQTDEGGIKTDSAPVEELKEKVEELQDLTESISQTAEKSADVQEEIVQAAEKVIPSSEDHKKPLSEPPASFSQSSGPTPLVIIIPGVLLLGALLGGIVFYQKSLSEKTESTPTPVASLVTQPSATPKSTVDLSKYKIKILNGGGVAGEATKVKTLLEDAGFSISSTGNAADYSYTKTIISVKEGVEKAFLEELRTTLGKTYQVGTGDTLPETSKDGIVVTVGSSKK